MVTDPTGIWKPSKVVHPSVGISQTLSMFGESLWTPSMVHSSMSKAFPSQSTERPLPRLPRVCMYSKGPNCATSNPPLANEKKAVEPLFHALRGHWGMVARVIALGAGQRVATFCILGYFVTALIQHGFGTNWAMFASLLLYFIGGPSAVLGGLLADKIGGRKVLIGGYLIFVVMTVPLFTILAVSTSLTLFGLVIFAIINSFVAPPLSYLYIMSFPQAVRGAAAALNFNLGTVLIGATAPLIATWLVSYTGSEIAFGWYVTLFCVISCITALMAYPQHLTDAATR